MGGLVGRLLAGSILQSYSTATISGTTVIGGLVGQDVGNNFNDCYFNGSVTGTGATVGGITGILNGDISNVFVAGHISGSDGVGGISGITGVGTSVSDSFSTAQIDSLMNSYLTVDGSTIPTNVYYWIGAICTGTCATVGMGDATLADFYNPLMLPHSAWDFTTIWQSNAGTYPSLR